MTRAELVSQMVAALRCIDVDLGDERDVLRKLVLMKGFDGSTHRFQPADIMLCVDEVIEETRRQGLKRTWA